MGEQSKKLGVMMLAALVVSAMVGGGIFSLPQNMSQGAGAGAVLIAWIITGVGIFFLANTFRILADARPDATTGIYACRIPDGVVLLALQRLRERGVRGAADGRAGLLLSGLVHARQQHPVDHRRLLRDLADELPRAARREAGGVPERGRHDLQARPDRAVHPRDAVRR